MSVIQIRPYRERRGASRRRAALDGLSDATRWVFDTIGKWHRRSRERHQLASLNERMLKDIGLPRAEREFLVNKWFWRE